jgi:hypothetical protein
VREERARTPKAAASQESLLLAFIRLNNENNEELFQMNADIHSFNTRHKHCLHKPIVNLSCFQKDAYYAGIRIINGLPSDLKSLMNEKAQFKIALKRYLNTHSLYFVDDYLLCRK